MSLPDDDSAPELSDVIPASASEHFDPAAMEMLRSALFKPPESIGAYRILERLGGGGMGDVYRAEQRDGVRRHVAVKLIKPGFDSRQVITRFEAEQQAMAMMHHPCIAQIFAAGNDKTGRPYFVMEYVPGEPITRFADTNRLTVRERLELFVQVCSAISHAHTKLIIHRDIKAGNVLAYYDEQQRPVVKVIDFGLAKALAGNVLSEDTLFTMHGAVMGTYYTMSPEQAAGSRDIDTRTDVYSLGVLLYELLTGAKPFDYAKEADQDIRRIICDVEPPPPHTRLSSLGEAGGRIASARRLELDALTKELKSELEWIPLKAMRKERDRRYVSAAALAEDVERYLQGEPLEAAPPTLAYRAQKLFSKHRGAVSAVAAIIASLTIGVIGTTTMSIRYRAVSAREATRADSEAKARQAAELESYVANIGAAQAALASDNYAEAKERLNACAESRRGWEWKFLERRVENVVGTIPSSSRLIGFTRAGDRMAVKSDEEHSIQWWDTAGHPTGQLISTGNTGLWTKLDANGAQLLTATADGVIGLWDRAGAPIHPPVLTGEKWETATLSGDGTKIVGKSSGGVVSTWDSMGQRLGGPLKIDDDTIRAAYFSDDGSRVITESDRPNDVSVYRFWDVNLKPIGQPIQVRRAMTVSFAKDAARTTILNEQTGEVRLLGSEGTEIDRIVLGNEKWSGVTFNPQGTLILTQSDKTGCLWDREGRQIGEPMKFARIGELVFSPDGTHIASRDEPTGLIQLWDEHGKAIASLISSKHSFSFSPNGQRIVTFDRCIRIWDATGQLVGGPFTNPCDDYFDSSFEFSADNSRMLVVESDKDSVAWRMWLYDIAGRNLACWFDGNVFRQQCRNSLDLNAEKMFSPDGRHVLVEREGSNCLIVSAENFSPPAEYIEDDLEFKWPFVSTESTPQSPVSGQGGNSESTKNGPSNKSGIEYLRTAAPKIAEWLDVRHRSDIFVVEDHSHTRLLTSGGKSDPTLRLWDLASQRQVASFPVSGMYYKNSETMLSDGTSRKDNANFHLVRSGITSLEFANDDQRIILTAYDPLVHWHTEIWDISDPATKQHDREARSQKTLSEKEWAKRHLSESIIRLRDHKSKAGLARDSWTNVLRDNRLNPYDVEQAVFELDSSISPLQRRAIFDTACELADELDAKTMAVWTVVELKEPSPDQAKAAVRQATEIYNAIPSAANLNTLAVALYRNGDFAGAMDCFKRRDAMFGADYEETAFYLVTEEAAEAHILEGQFFKAMTLFKLGDPKAARALLARAEAGQKRSGPPRGSLAVVFVEADALIRLPKEDDTATKKRLMKEHVLRAPD